MVVTALRQKRELSVESNEARALQQPNSLNRNRSEKSALPFHFLKNTITFFILTFLSLSLKSSFLIITLTAHSSLDTPQPTTNNNHQPLTLHHCIFFFYLPPPSFCLFSQLLPSVLHGSAQFLQPSQTSDKYSTPQSTLTCCLHCCHMLTLSLWRMHKLEWRCVCVPVSE